MASTKELILAANTEALAQAAVDRARDPNRFPWKDADILRVSGNNPLIARALEMEAVLTKAAPAPVAKAAKVVKPKARKAPKVSTWLKAKLEEAAALVERLVEYGTNKVTIAIDGEDTTGTVYSATLGEPTIGPRGGVTVLCTLKQGKRVAATYELSGNQAQRLFEGGNCGTTVGHVLRTV